MNRILQWLTRATGIFYKRLVPLDKTPEFQHAVRVSGHVLLECRRLDRVTASTTRILRAKRASRSVAK